jgi:hypothetical protein
VDAILYRLRWNLRSRGPAAAGLAAVVAVTVGVVLTLAAGAVRTLSAPDRYSASRDSGLDVIVEQYSGRPRTAELERLDAVEEARAATFVFGGLVPSGGGPDEITDALVFAGAPEALATTVVAGRAPDPTTTDEFVGTRGFTESTGAALGDRFDLFVIPQAAADSAGFDAATEAVPVATATLVGVVDGANMLQDPTGIAVFPAALLDNPDVGVSSTQTAVALAPGSTQDDLRRQLVGLDAAGEFGITESDWVAPEVRAAVRAQGQGLAVLAAIVAVATVVVVGQLLGRQMRVGDDERLVLRSIGMTRRQVVGDQLAAAAVPTLAGAAAAIGLAYLASGLFPVDFVRNSEPDPGLRFEPVAVVGGAAALAAAILAWVAVAVSTSNPSARSTDLSLIEAVARRLPRRGATALRLGFTRRGGDPTRPAAAVAGCALAVGVLVGALTFGSSLRDLVQAPDRWGQSFDLGIGQGGGAVPDDVVAALEDDEDIAAVTLYGNVLATVGSEGFDVTGALPVRGSTAPHLFGGRVAEGADEIVVGRVAAERFGVGIGDELAVVGPAGPTTLTVTGLGVIPGIEGGDGMGEGGLVTIEGLRHIDPSAVPTAAGIQVRPGASPEAVAKRLSDATGVAVMRGFSPPSVILNVGRVRSIPFVVAGVLAALVVLNVAHYLVLLTRRRRRDIAVLKALGADGPWVTGVVHWQASLFTLFVVGLGAPLGFVTGRVVYRAFVQRIGAIETVTVPIGIVALVIAGLLVLANLVAAPSALRARQRLPSRLLGEE